MLDAIGSGDNADLPVKAQPCTVVIPCYNEAARFHVGEFVRFLENVKSDRINLLFVNDGSSDSTLSVLSSFQDKFPARVSLLDQQPNRGKAEAVRNGMLRVIADNQAIITGFWDADLATPLDQILDFRRLLEIRPEVTMVFGARVRLLGRDIHRQAIRHYLGRCFATVVSRLLRLHIYDTQCGAKLFRITPELRHILAEPFHSRWIFDVEVLARFLSLHKHDHETIARQIYEYPLPVWTDVAGSKVTPVDFLRAFAELGTIYRRDLSK